jgi:hypothetical protein
MAKSTRNGPKGRPKQNPSRRTSYKPKTKGAFARSLAAQVDSQNNNLNLLIPQPDGTLKPPTRTMPTDFNPASFSPDPRPVSVFL